MKSVPALLLKYRKLGIRIWADEGKLRFKAPPKVVTPELKDELKRYKEDILSYLVRLTADSAEPTITPVPRAADLPLSYSQQRLWFLYQLEGASPVYNLPMCVGLTGPLSVASLFWALGEIVARHEGLRTVFQEKNGHPRQVITPPERFDLPVVDLSGLETVTRETLGRKLANQAAAYAFNLAVGPLFRALVLRLKENDHVLSINKHHIVSDGWSIGVVTSELAVLYRAAVEGRPSPLPPLAIQYADYSAWQQGWLSGENLERQIKFWKEHLEGSPSLLSLPLDYPRPPMQTFNGSGVAFQVDPDVAERLEAITRKSDASMFMLSLAVFYMLLSRYSGQDNVVIGTPIANRHRKEVEPLVGFFVNTLVIHQDMSGNPSFLDLLKQVRHRTTQAFSHQDLPFDKLVEELQPERSLSHSPLFQVMFSMMNVGKDKALSLPGLRVGSLGVEGDTAKFDLTLTVSHGGRGMIGGVNFNKDLFHPETMMHFASHLRNLFTSVAWHSELPIDRISMMGSKERELLLKEWNHDEPDHEPLPAVHDQIIARGLALGDKTAVWLAHEQGESEAVLSFQQLIAASNHLAARLIASGVGLDQVVGVCLPRGPGMIVSLLAVMQAGGVFLPLDPAYPEERLAFMLADSSAEILISTPDLKATLPPTDLPCLEPELYPAASPASWEAQPEGAGMDGAYLIYTSGSTGTPKGVLVGHRALSRHCRNVTHDFELRAGERVLQFASFNFDPALEQTLPALAAGAALVTRGEALWSTARTGEVFKLADIAVANLPAAFWFQLTRDWRRRPQEIPRDTALRLMIVGGEAMSVKGVELWRQLGLAGVSLRNAYGPTETTITASFFTLPETRAFERIPIGRPGAYRTMYILSKRMRLQPIGVPGELYIGGVSLARGYLGRPELTALSFPPNPYGSNEGTIGRRLYRTGDLARFLYDGNLVFMGRVDFQVKLRGFRVELEEIEALLVGHPRIRAAAVLVVPFEGDQRLIGFVEAGQGDDLEGDAGEFCRQHLKGKLPAYMMPSQIVALERLPLLPSGKADRNRLKKMADSHLRDAPMAGPQAHVEPRGPIEEGLAEIWAEVLKRERIGAHDDFFAMGGHSLLATQVISRIREAFSADLPLRALFAAPTVAGLAHVVREAARSGEAREEIPIEPVPRDGAMPLSFAQQRLWFLSRLDPDSITYNMPTVLQLIGRLDVAALERSIETIIARHEILRVTFGVQNNEPVQHFAEPQDLNIPVVDLSRFPEDLRFPTARTVVGRATARPFDLDRGPLLRLHLLRLAGDHHVFVMDTHHIISDGWSQGVMVRELVALYGAHINHQPPLLPTLPIQYADYAYWQRQWLTGEVLEAQLTYWRDQLQGTPPLLELPTDRPRPAMQTFNGAIAPIGLGVAETERLNELARAHGATMFMLVQAVFALLLSRYSRQDDVVVGSPVANRNRRESEGLIGFFVNTLVLRTDLSGNPSFVDLLERVHQTSLDAFARQDLPFEHIVEVLQPERDMSHSPIFQVMLVLQNTPGEGLTLPGLTLGGMPTEHVVSKFDLTMTIGESGHGLRGGLEYNTDLFDGETIQRFGRHLENLFRAVSSTPERAIDAFSLLDEAERREALVTWNQTDDVAPHELTIAQVIDQIVQTQPDHSALHFAGLDIDQTLTYAGLRDRAAQIAARLRELGGDGETLVAVCCPRSVELYAAILGVWWAGHAYLPLDPSLPAERLSFMLSDAQPGVVLCHDIPQDLLPVEGPLKLDLAAIKQTDAAALEPRIVAPLNPAYMIYTSGSTGRPKGTLLNHRGLHNLTRAHRQLFAVEPRHRVLQFASMSFDASIWETVMAWGNGAVLCTAERDQIPPGEALHQWLAKNAVSHVTLPPTALAWLSERGLDDLSRLIVAGEACGPDLPLRFGRDRHFVNAYGPTETTVCASASFCKPDGTKPTIGQAILNTRLYVLDRTGEPVPLGVPGELFIGGAGLARGYHRRPDLTAERFVPSPFDGEQPGTRLYRSGDLVRRLPSGELDFLGRIDHQVKLRGFRVELGEIEARLREVPGVSEAAVLVRGRGDQLVGLVQGGEAAAPDNGEMRAFLSQRLPEYMVPARFIVLDQFPLTNSGKVDRKALARLADAPEHQDHETLTEPRDEIERQLAVIWGEVLKRDKVGVNQNFFELGGHSLLATQVISRVREAFLVELPLRALFSTPTVASLANTVRDAGGGDLAAMPPLQVMPREGRPPLSFAQQRMWFLNRLEPGSPTYNIPGSYHLHGHLDVPTLQRAIDEIVRRHETLRTSFPLEDGRPYPHIEPAAGKPIALIDLSDVTNKDQQLRALVTASAVWAFDLERGPLALVHLLRLGPRDHALLMNLHHIISDGWSNGVLIAEMTALYTAFMHDQPSPLPEPPIQYVDFAIWQQSWLSGEVLEAQLDYWKKHLADAPPLITLPLDKPRPPVQTFNGAMVGFMLEDAEPLNQLARQTGASLFMVLEAVFALLLSRYSRQDDVLVGSPIANRHFKEIEPLIGFFVNTLVFRNDLSGEPTFMQLLERTRQTAFDAFARQDLPFEQIVEGLQPERDISHSALIQVLFVFQNTPGGEGASLPGLQLGGLGSDHIAAKFDITLTLNEAAGRLMGTFNYNTDLFEQDSIRRMARHFKTLIEQVVAQPERRCSSIDLLDQDERGRLLREWSGFVAEVSPEPLYLYSDWATRRPDGLAVAYENEAGVIEHLSFDALLSQASILALRLRRMGVGPDSAVGIHLERGVPMIQAVVAVLLAGGAYLPLDPAYPKDRLAFLLDDARVPVMLTTRELAVEWPEISCQVFHMEDHFEQGDSQLEPAVLDPANLAYIIYTSGTTGRPKGVGVTHGGVANLAPALEQVVYADDASEAMRVAVNGSLSFDTSVKQIIQLFNGRSLHPIPESIRLDGHAFLDYLKRHRLQSLDCTPSMAGMLVEAGLLEQAPGLKHVLLGGEAVEPALWRRLSEVTGTRFHNLYGPTECTVDATVQTLEAGRPTIGRPIAGVGVYALDAQLSPVPIGVPGELYIGGNGVSRGYLGRPDLTAERFVPDPFAGEAPNASAGGRLYRTGDLARLLGDGRVVFMGRADNQIKLRGFRIELGEIEAAVRDCPAVNEAAVLLRKIPGQADQRLIAYLGIGDRDAEECIAKVRADLADRLPAYMVPAAFVGLPSLPLTPNGKLDRRALPEPDDASFRRAGVPPRDPVETELAQIWCEILKRDQVGVYDNFFEMGGHSLLATRVFSRVRERFQVELPLRTLFTAPTVAGLAQAIREAGVAGLVSLPPLRPMARDQKPPLSFAQQRMWFLNRLEPGSPTYNMPAAYHLHGVLDVAVLQRAIDEIVRRHENLRTAFPTEDGNPQPYIAPPNGLPITLTDLSDRVADENHVRALVTAAAVRGFDLERGPLARVHLLRLSTRDHALLVNLHHIISDGWSTGVLIAEMSTLYTAYIGNAPSPLPELPIQYADFAAWQRSWLTGEVLEAQLAYWKERLADAPALITLPLDKPRPPVQTYNGAVVGFMVEDAAPLNGLAQKSGASLFMVLEAAFALLLSRYSRQDDVLVGSPIANRHFKEIEPLIGFFVNTLVFRNDLSGDPSFMDLLERTRQTAFDAFARQDLPFEQIVEGLQPERDISHSALFQVLFVMQNTPGGEGASLPGLQLGGLGSDHVAAKFDITLTVNEAAGRLMGNFNYNTDLFEDESMRRMARHYQTLLAQIAGRPEQPCSAMDLLDRDERRRLLDEWSGFSVEPKPDPLYLFGNWAQLRPDGLAVSYENEDGQTEHLSFGALQHEAQRLAMRLRSFGVGPDVAVGIHLERGVPMVQAVLAAILAGGAYLPLDPAYPHERLAFLLADSRVPVMLTTRELAEQWTDIPCRVIQLDQPCESADTSWEPNDLDRNNLAYIIYTSGTTGRPKGVGVTHGGVANLLLALARAVYADNAGEALRVGVNGSLSFDTSVKQIVQLFNGCSLHPIPEAIRLDGNAFSAYLAKHRVEVLDATPSMLGMLLEARLLDQAVGLRHVLLGGEAVEPALWRRLSAVTGARFHNLYGPTECTVDATVQTLSGERPTIGRAVANVGVYLLDGRLKPVPIGVPGELYIGGRGVSRGYLGRPDLSAERFVPDPFAGEAPNASAGGRLYRTGDLARLLTDGRIAFMGRADNQIKLRGFRIELGEIEAAIRDCPGVNEAAVLLKTRKTAEPRLVAYLGIGEGDAAESITRLRGFLDKRLPAYMVPAAFVGLPSLPLTPNGKLDRRALPQPDDSAFRRPGVAPRDRIESGLAGIWGEILNRENVGVQDNFFELGGHSLLATRVFSRVRERFKVDLPLRTLFAAPTIEGLAQAVREAGRAGVSFEETPILPVPRDQAMPLSFAQQRLWFLNRLDPNSITYNMPTVLHLAGRLDVTALTRAIETIVARHEILRVTFGVEAGEPVQHFAQFGPLNLPVVDLSRFPEATRFETARAMVGGVTARPFDLERGPLLYLQLLRLAQDQHVFVMNTHHIISDGWSQGVMTRELAALYTASLNDQPSPLPPLAIQYADYAYWQRQWLSGQVLEDQLTYWRLQLEDAPPLLELPTDRPRPAMQTFNGAISPVALDRQASEKLLAFARERGATLFMLVEAVYTLLLSRYSRQDDVVIGSPVANRNRTESEGLIGFFVNTLVLRTNLAGNPSFVDLLERVRQTSLDAFARQDLPFEHIVEVLQPQRDMSHSPLFQVMLVLQNTPGEGLSLPGLTLGGLPTEHVVSKFDLTLSLGESPNGLRGGFEYNTDLFDAETVQRMGRHLVNLFHAVIAAPEQSIDAYHMLDETERRDALFTWNQTDDHAGETPAIGEHIAQIARAYPHAVALHFSAPDGDRILTYAALTQRATQIAAELAPLKGSGETLVAVCCPRSVDLYTAILGVWWAGCTYLPLDPSLPVERLRFMLADAQPAAVLCGYIDPEILSDDGPLKININQIQATGASGPSQVDPLNPAYMIYTSGSTGRPKGTLLTHRGLHNLTRTHHKLFAVAPGHRVAQFASMSFDASVWETVMAWGNGAVLCAAQREQLLPGVALHHWLDQNAVSHVTLPPTALAYLSEQGLDDLTHLIVAGEACGSELPARFGQGRQFVNAYGPTETTVCASASFCSGDEQKPTIGHAILNTRLYVLDRAGNPVPVGVPGQLFIAGTGLARGYHRRPDLTAERFVPHPFSGDQAGERLYASGDLVRRLASGEIDFLGRIDHQVKLRGFRVELGEIEARLREFPHVSEAAVLVQSERDQLVGFVQVEADAAIDQAILREFLSSRLPEYMVPARLIPSTQFPLTNSGKVDRKALAKLAQSTETGDPHANLTPPRDETERQLAAIWCEVLGREQVGIHQNFFELGGHSLLATRVISSVRAAFQLEIPLQDLFAAPTIAAFAERVARANRDRLVADAPPMVPVPRDQSIPLSFAQQRMWFLHRMEPDSPVYHLPSSFHLSGPLDVSALTRALSEIWQRHESLRTVFPQENGEPVQVFLPDHAMHPPLIDLSHLSQPMETGAALLIAHNRRPFDLARGPLWRVLLLRVAPDHHALLLTMHHIVSDGWSMGILTAELGKLYRHFSEGGDPNAVVLPPLPLQYADFAHWQRGWLRGDVLQRQLDFWRDALAGAPALLELPIDFPRPPMQTYNGAVEPFTLDAELSEAVIALGKRQGATPFMTLLAAFGVLLARYSGQDDVVVGSPVANRNRKEIEGLIGFFVNTLVPRVQVNPGASFLQLLTRVQRNVLDAFACQDIPFEQIVEHIRPERHLAYSPIFQVMFTLQNLSLGGGPGLPGLSLAPIGGGGVTAKYDLSLTLIERERGLSGSFEYNTDLFRPDTVKRFVAGFEILLRGIAAEPETALSHIDLLSESERRKLLDEWGNGGVLEYRPEPVHRLIEARIAAGASGRIWLADQPEAALSYRQLNKWADQIAAKLHALGVGPECVVGVHLNRSLASVCALLAVLKRGGVYLPLDPAYPEDRLAFMLQDARAVAVIADQADLSFAGPIPVLPVTRDLEPEATLEGIAQPTIYSENSAYIIYTSGSTGQPKGVRVAHDPLTRHSQDVVQALDLKQGDRVLQHTSLNFDPSLEQILPALLADADLVMRGEALWPVEYLGQVISEQGVTSADIPASYWLQLLQLWEREGAPENLALRHFIIGGEAMPPNGPALQHKIGLTRVQVINAYGPTEAVISATLYDAPCDQTYERVPIGGPRPGRTAYVLDKTMRPTPIGVAGALYLGGPCLAVGYQNQPDRTAQVWLPDPFQGEGARLYATGDRARFLADGRIDFLGRIDQQVKLRGFRIEPGEIEALLNRHESVKESVVIVWEEGGGSLVAYLTLNQDNGDSGQMAEQLKDYLNKRLPSFMLPSAFVVLPQIPLTPNGKVDRNKLPAPDQTHVGQTFLAPRNETELKLCRIWSQVLNREAVGIRDNFFEMGGHSMLAVRLVSLIRNEFGRELPLAVLFQAPTVEAMAGLLNREGETPQSGIVVPIRVGGERPPFFCVHPIGGNVMCYTALAWRLPTDQPFYGLQSPGLIGEPMLDKVETIAARYIQAIREVQPQGPYRLGGWSFGGVIAYEMARQLKEKGEDVALLALMDAYVPKRKGGFWPKKTDQRELLAAFIADLGDVQGISPNQIFQALEGQHFNAEELMEVLLNQGKKLGILPPEMGAAGLTMLWETFKANYQANSTYKPKPYQGEAIIFSAKNNQMPQSQEPDPTHGWSKVIKGKTQVELLEGNHYTILQEPSVAAVADMLSNIM